jgi:hypothetical protein
MWVWGGWRNAEQNVDCTRNVQANKNQQPEALGLFTHRSMAVAIKNAGPRGQSLHLFAALARFRWHNVRILVPAGVNVKQESCCLHAASSESTGGALQQSG